MLSQQMLHPCFSEKQYHKRKPSGHCSCVQGWPFFLLSHLHGSGIPVALASPQGFRLSALPQGRRPDLAPCLLVACDHLHATRRGFATPTPVHGVSLVQTFQRPPSVRPQQADFSPGPPSAPRSGPRQLFNTSSQPSKTRRRPGMSFPLSCSVHASSASRTQPGRHGPSSVSIPRSPAFPTAYLAQISAKSVIPRKMSFSSVQPHVAPGLYLIPVVFSEAVTVPGTTHVLAYTCVTDGYMDAFLPKH